MVTVSLPPALLGLFPDCPREHQLAAASIAEVLDMLDAQWPGLRDRLCDSTPRIRRHINVFVDGERASLDTGLRDGADVFIMTAVSGG